MSERTYRRVVTGLNAEGKSCVVIDGAIPRAAELPVALAWRTDSYPADNAGDPHAELPPAMEVLQDPGSNFAICRFSAGTPAFMHATDTIDYLVILSGRIKLVLEAGEVELQAGDFIVDRGVIHGWANPYDEPCVAAVVNIPAHPVGNGRTI